MTGIFSRWFDGMPIVEVAKFFIKGLRKGDINMRASALSFSFFLALFPSVLFLFTLIPYIPIDNFQNELLKLLKTVIPEQAYIAVRETIEDIVGIKRGGVLSIGFIMALYFATNGTKAMMMGFNKSYHGSVKQSAWMMQWRATYITIILAVMVITAIGLLVGHSFIVRYIYKQQFVNKALYLLLVDSGKWIIMLLLCFFSISCLYYLGPSRKRKFRFISAGSSLATILIILTSIVFNYVVSNFTNYNKVYGSIGTLIIMMLYIRFNCLQLLIGFELNASIDNAKERADITKEKNNKADMVKVRV
ncbi:MAG: YihY/virulence factor BrkB family protein [Bacteroidetes bacterium]|nr:YihY/virulence factor BrkB family protein [Bacteroidota bacterium]